MQQSEQITNFYRHIRAYWESLSTSSAGQKSGILNFGYWPDGSDDLYQAQQNLLDKVRSGMDPAVHSASGLEIGCGIGGISIGMLKARPSLNMTAIDISAEQLDIARQNAIDNDVLARLRLTECSAMALAFDTAHFDFTLCVESSFHYDDKAAFMQENFRVLKPGGQAILVDITCENNAGVTYRHGNHFEGRAYYVALAEATGFSVESFEDIGPAVYQPLHRHIVAYNKRQRQASGKYWSVVLRNYANLAGQGTMGYHIFRLRKPV
jgi:MPBQ/MSBQ methyltransferase